jgi:hypothetical protein
MPKKIEPIDVTSTKTPGAAAKKLHAYLRQWAKDTSYGPALDLFLWSPEETENKGYGKFWAVVWESGPFEWPMITAGCRIEHGGIYSQPGPFPGGLRGRGWWTEQQNDWMILFIKD